MGEVAAVEPGKGAIGAPLEKVEFGLILALTIRGLALGTYEDIRRVGVTAEQLGFDSLWMCDHFLTLDPDAYAGELNLDGERSGQDTGPATMPLLECWTTISALSRDTERINVGTSVLCNNYREPAVLAKMAATLDVISGGRVELGIGAGWFEAEYTAYGFDFPPAKVRVSQLEESLEIIRRVWTDADPTFEGEHYRISGAVCDPRPVQDPYPRIWVGGEGDRVHRISSRLATGFNARWWSPERFAERATFLAEACATHGRDPSTLHSSATLAVICSYDADDVARQRARFTAIPEDGFVLGDPERCIERLKAYVDAGVHHFLFTVPDVADTETLQLLGTHVLPAVREYAAARAGR